VSRLCGWAFVATSLLGFLVVASMLLGVGPTSQIGLPVPAGPDAVQVDRQLVLLFSITGFVFAGTSVAVVWLALGRRRSAEHGTSSQSDARSTSLWLMPALLGVAVLAIAECSGWFCHIPAVPAVGRPSQPDNPGDVWAKLRIRAYECQITYPGPDRRMDTLDDIRSAGELRVPSNKVVTIQLETDDGPHRWYIPSLRRSVDLSKGEAVQIPINVDVSGVFDMVFIDLSGYREDAFPGRLVVEEAVDVRNWLHGRAQEQQRRQLPDPQVQP
jgi:heme/copper-type cytochrome/quinol oxidase subunit 2